MLCSHHLKIRKERAARKFPLQPYSASARCGCRGPWCGLVWRGHAHRIGGRNACACTYLSGGQIGASRGHHSALVCRIRHQLIRSFATIGTLDWRQKVWCVCLLVPVLPRARPLAMILHPTFLPQLPLATTRPNQRPASGGQHRCFQCLLLLWCQPILLPVSSWACSFPSGFVSKIASSWSDVATVPWSSYHHTKIA